MDYFFKVFLGYLKQISKNISKNSSKNMFEFLVKKSKEIVSKYWQKMVKFLEKISKEIITIVFKYLQNMREFLEEITNCIIAVIRFFLNYLLVIKQDKTLFKGYLWMLFIYFLLWILCTIFVISWLWGGDNKRFIMGEAMIWCDYISMWGWYIFVYLVFRYIRYKINLKIVKYVLMNPRNIVTYMHYVGVPLLLWVLYLLLWLCYILFFVTYFVSLLLISYKVRLIDFLWSSMESIFLVYFICFDLDLKYISDIYQFIIYCFSLLIYNINLLYEIVLKELVVAGIITLKTCIALWVFKILPYFFFCLKELDADYLLGYGTLIVYSIICMVCLWHVLKYAKVRVAVRYYNVLSFGVFIFGKYVILFPWIVYKKYITYPFLIMIYSYWKYYRLWDIRAWFETWLLVINVKLGVIFKFLINVLPYYVYQDLYAFWLLVVSVSLSIWAIGSKFFFKVMIYHTSEVVFMSEGLFPKGVNYLAYVCGDSWQDMDKWLMIVDNIIKMISVFF